MRKTIEYGSAAGLWFVTATYPDGRRQVLYRGRDMSEAEDTYNQTDLEEYLVNSTENS